MTQENDSSWADDDQHPIPFINALDVLAKFDDGTRNLTILVASAMDDSPYSQKRLLNKIQNYIHYISSEKYAAEFGSPTPELVSVVVKIHSESSPLVFELLGKCENWVKSGSASLVVEKF